MTKISVTFKIAELVVTEVTTTLDVDSEEEKDELLSDPSALHYRLADEKDEWIDKIDPLAGAVLERNITEIVSVTDDTKEK